MDPFTIFSLVTGGLKIGQELFAGKARKDQADFNAAVASVKSQEVSAWAAYDEDRLRRAQKFRKDEMVVQLLKQGATIDEGTTADLILREQSIEDELEALVIRNQGASEAAAFDFEAQLFRRAGRKQKKVALTAGIGQAFSTLTSIASLKTGSLT